MSQEPAPETALEMAAKRLDRAVSLLERKLTRGGGSSDPGGLFQEDRSRLAAELDQARARERALEEAGAEASAAFGRAIAEIEAALAGAPDETESA
jgi:hypothetical protein